MLYVNVKYNRTMIAAVHFVPYDIVADFIFDPLRHQIVIEPPARGKNYETDYTWVKFLTPTCISERFVFTHHPMFLLRALAKYDQNV